MSGTDVRSRAVYAWYRFGGCYVDGMSATEVVRNVVGKGLAPTEPCGGRRYVELTSPWGGLHARYRVEPDGRLRRVG